MMSKLIFTFFFLITFALNQGFACDICGCSSGSYFIGPFPQFSNHFIETRYSFEKYGTILSSDNTQFSNDFYQTTELMAGTNIKNKWQLLMFVPYNFLYSKSDDGINRSSGIGDLTLMGNYNLLESVNLNRDTVTVRQQLWVGGGLKVPTGKFSVNPDELISSANSQPGTGSFDYVANLIYSFQIKSWGFNVNSSYRINQYADHYRFGNRLNLSAFIYRTFHIGKIGLSPNVGIINELLASNMDNHKKVADTGGHILMSVTGIELKFNNIVLGFNDQIPLSSNLSSGQTDAKFRGMCHLSYMF